MTTINQNQKGKRGERLAVKLLNEAEPSLKARRSKQYSGIGRDVHSADVVTTDKRIRIEMKHGYDNISVGGKVMWDWWEKACRESFMTTPFFMWKRTYGNWVFIVPVVDFDAPSIVTPVMLMAKKDNAPSVTQDALYLARLAYDQFYKGDSGRVRVFSDQHGLGEDIPTEEFDD